MGQTARFEAMYRVHCGAVRAFVHRRTAAAVADDVVAEVFVTAWRRLDEAPSEELPWLLGIARGLLANERRADARRTALRDRLAATTVPAAAESPAGWLGEESEVVRALRSLGPRDQEVLLLVAWDGLDRTQAAQVLETSVAAFAVRLHRARRRLERAMSPHSVQRGAGERSAMEVL